jgi:hypothetical protein
VLILQVNSATIQNDHIRYVRGVLLSRTMQRTVSGRILRIRIGAEFQQQADHLFVFANYGMHQSCTSFLISLVDRFPVCQ